MGWTPSYADFHIVSFLEWCKCFEGDVFQRVIGVDDALVHV